MAAIVSDLKFVAAIVSNLKSSLVAIAASAEKALAEEKHRHKHKTAALEKALADDTNEQSWAAVQEKALADEANEQRRAAAWEKALANEANKRRCHELAERTTTLATKALAEDEYNEDNDYVARWIEAYAAPFFARVDAVMAKIRAMDDGFGKLSCVWWRATRRGGRWSLSSNDAAIDTPDGHVITPPPP
jgi:hypothetical protein